MDILMRNYQLTHAFKNILTNKLRSLLAILGILVGTASVVAMVSSGQMATIHALAEFKQLGTDLLSVSFFKEAQTTSTQTNLTIKDIKQMPAFVPQIKQISGYTMLYVPVAYQDKQLNAVIVGADNELMSVIKVNIATGRALSFLDKNSMYCVIGNAIAKKLKTKGVFNPIGQQILLGDSYFTIIGVAKPWQENSFFEQNINQSVIVPLNASLLLSQQAKIGNIVMRLNEGTDIDNTEKNIQNYISQILPGQSFYFKSAKQIMTSMANQQKTLTIMLGLIGSISLFVGGIGVMNIMLVSVTERKREIGIRKAIGAKQKDIKKLFLTESMMLSLFGGFLGVIAGIIATFIIAHIAHWSFHLFALPIIIGFLVSVLVGIFFGFYPAVKAAKLNPMEILRSE